MPKEPSDKERISVTLMRNFTDILDGFIDEGFYIDRQDAIRSSLRILFGLHGVEPFSQIIFPKGEITFPKGDEVIE